VFGFSSDRHASLASGLIRPRCTESSNSNGCHMRYVRFHNFPLFVFIMAGMLYGCWFSQRTPAAEGNSTPAEMLTKGKYGIRTETEPTVTWIKDEASLNAIYQKLNARSSGKVTEVPKLNFNTFGLLFLEMGQKPSGGYAINFEALKTQVDNGQLVVHLSWDVPAQGMTVTQVITSPFLLLKIKHADINSILVLDQNNQSLFEVPVK